MSRFPDVPGAIVPTTARPVALSSAALVLANLVPLWAVVRGHLGVGDLFVLYWAENAVVWAVTIVKVATAAAPGAVTQDDSDEARVHEALTGVPPLVVSLALAAFFAVHYGIFTLVHGVFARVIAGMTGGLEADTGWWTLSILVLAASHLLSLVLNWFGRGERLRTTSRDAMSTPYPRMIVLHASVIGAFFLLAAWNSAVILPALLLCGLKTVVDLAFHRREHTAS